MPKKKKTDYRFSRVKGWVAPVPASSAKVIVTPKSRPFDPPPPSGEDWVSFVGLSELHRVPATSAVISIAGNGRHMDSGHYTRFAGHLPIELNSTMMRQNVNHEITPEFVQNILDFVALHVGRGVYVQCGAGEQRSVALAMAINDTTDRYLDISMPGCKGDTRYMDQGIYTQFRRVHRSLAKES